MTVELEPAHESAVAAIMTQFNWFMQQEPGISREFLWRLHYSINVDEAEVHRMTCWLYWWDVWPVSWEDTCDLISGALTDEQRQLRIAGSTLGPGLAWAELPRLHPHLALDE